MINCISTTESIILKSPSTVDIPIEEYKSLIRSEQLAELTKRALGRCKTYELADVLDILYKPDEDELMKNKHITLAAIEALIKNRKASDATADQNKEETTSEPESE